MSTSSQSRVVVEASSASPSVVPMLGAAGRIGAQDALFGIKTFVAAMLAYGTALEIGLPRPYWAVTTCFIVAQPLAGAVLSKAVFRLIGTFVGAAVAVALVPLLVDAPELLTLAFALWLGVCTYLSMLDRSPRAYVFLLSGYTAAIIGFPSVATPDHVFEIAVVRAEEIGIGILASTLIHALIFPRSVTAQVMRRIDRMMADAAALSRAVLIAGSDQHARDLRQRLIEDFGGIDALATHLPYDLNRQHVRQDLLHAFRHELMQILALAGAVRDRLRRLGDTLRADFALLLADATEWFERPDDGEALLARARTLEALPSGDIDFRDGMRLSLLDRLEALIVAHRNCREITVAIGQPRRRPSSLVADILRDAHRPKRHLDHGLALRSAVATSATVAIGCTFWIATAWPDGASAVVLASIVCALYANLDEPSEATRHVLYGVVVATLIAAVYVFALMPRITDFPVLAMALAPTILIVSTLNQQPGCGALSIGLILALPGLIGLGDRYNGDFVQFSNNAAAQILGACLAAAVLGLVRSVGTQAARIRLMGAGRRSVVKRFETGRTDPARHWIAAMFDRVALLSTNTITDGEAAAEQIAEMLRYLRLGLAADAMWLAARQIGGRDASLIRQLLRRGRKVLLEGEGGDPADQLFELATARMGRIPDAQVRRTAILALISLRCNLAR